MSIETIKVSGFLLMDEVSSMLTSGNIYGCMEHLFLGMRDIRLSFGQDVWPEFALKTFQEHSLTNLIYQCPLTTHSFTKPRGYADLIDFTSGSKNLPNQVTLLGKDIFESLRVHFQ